MKDILKIVFFSCLISVSYGSSADEWDEMRDRLKEQMSEADYTGMGPEIGSNEWSACRDQGGC